MVAAQRVRMREALRDAGVIAQNLALVIANDDR